VPASDEVAWLRARVAELEELNARLREAAAARDELAAAQLATRDARIAALTTQAEELRRRLDKDSPTSSKPPSSDSPHKKKPRGAARLVAALTGVNVSAGLVAGIRGKAARLLAPFTERVRELLPAAPVRYAGKTPARAAGTLHYVHVACTEFLTAMHTGDRTGEAIDAGGVLPGYAGTIVRDG
jgi:hypothetical protein